MEANDFKPGEYAYIVESNVCVSRVYIVTYSNGFYTIRLESGGAIRVGKSRLFKTYDDALASMKKHDIRKSITNW